MPSAARREWSCISRTHPNCSEICPVGHNIARCRSGSSSHQGIIVNWCGKGDFGSVIKTLLWMSTRPRGVFVPQMTSDGPKCRQKPRMARSWFPRFGITVMKARYCLWCVVCGPLRMAWMKGDLGGFSMCAHGPSERLGVIVHDAEALSQSIVLSPGGGRGAARADALPPSGGPRRGARP